MENNYPTLSELIDAYEAGEVKEEGKSYLFYMSDEHRKSNNLGWIHDSEFKGYLIMRTICREQLLKALWGDNNGK